MKLGFNLTAKQWWFIDYKVPWKSFWLFRLYDHSHTLQSLYKAVSDSIV